MNKIVKHAPDGQWTLLGPPVQGRQVWKTAWHLGRAFGSNASRLTGHLGWGARLRTT